jgi:putative tricarboxylic transport membrane protein
MALFGALGYLLRKLDIPAAPIILTMTVGPLMEQALRQSLDISGGRFGIFVTRPIAAVLLVCAVLFLVTSTLSMLARVKGRDAQI